MASEISISPNPDELGSFGSTSLNPVEGIRFDPDSGSLLIWDDSGSGSWLPIDVPSPVVKEDAEELVARMELTVCGACGAVTIGDEGEEKHLLWHERLDDLLGIIVQNLDERSVA